MFRSKIRRKKIVRTKNNCLSTISIIRQTTHLVQSNYLLTSIFFFTIVSVKQNIKWYYYIFRSD